MEESDEDGNAFAIPNLWKPSLFEPFQIQSDSLQTEIWDTLNNGIDLGEEFRSEGDSIFKSSHGLSLTLPDLSSFQYGPLKTPTSVEPLYESIDDTTEDAESVEENPWSDANLWIQSSRPSEFRSWEIFYDKAFKEPRTAYLSEGGSLAFDAALCLHPLGTDNSLPQYNGRVVKSAPMLRVGSTTDDC